MATSTQTDTTAQQAVAQQQALAAATQPVASSDFDDVNEIAVAAIRQGKNVVVYPSAVRVDN